jgi:glycosyltransferase involved in cell wall biosynthesis
MFGNNITEKAKKITRRSACLIHHAGIQGYPYLINTANVLAQAGWQVYVIALSDDPLPSYRFQDPRIYAYRFPHIVKGVGKLQRLARFSLYILWAVTIALRRRCSAFIGFDQNGLIAASLASLRSSWAPVLYYVPELHVSTDLTSAMDRFKKLLERFFSRRAVSAIIQDRRRADVLAQDNGLDPKRVYIVPNAPLAGDGSIRRTDYLPRLLAQHGIEDSKTIVLHIGTVADVTRVRDIAQTVDRWPPACVFVVHGWGLPDYIKEIQRLALCDLPPRIIVDTEVLPYDQLDTLVCSADIGLALYDGGTTNRYEMASGKLYQYMKTGIPVIASDFPAMREVVEGNDAGICVDGSDMSTLVEAVHLLAGDPELCQRYGQNARRAFLEKYACERNLAPVLSLLESLLSRGASC